MKLDRVRPDGPLGLYTDFTLPFYGWRLLFDLNDSVL